MDNHKISEGLDIIKSSDKEYVGLDYKIVDFIVAVRSSRLLKELKIN